MTNERNLPILRHEVTASFCSICPEPGRCCRWFHFSKTYWKDEGLEAVQQNLIEHNYPFIVEKWSNQAFKAEDGREYGTVMCSCPKVTSDGRCSIYNERPRTCRVYAPGSDYLCVFNGSSGIKFHQ